MEGVFMVNRCYACRTVTDPNQEYELDLVFQKPAALPGENHSRSVRQFVCSKPCLALTLKTVADQLLEVR